MYCIQCGTKNEDNYEFCMNCGARLTATSQNVDLPPEVEVNEAQSLLPLEDSVSTLEKNIPPQEPEQERTVEPPVRTKTIPPGQQLNRHTDRKILLIAGIVVAALIVVGVILTIVTTLNKFVLPILASPETLIYTIQDASSAGPIVAINSLTADGNNNHELYSDSDGLTLANNFLNFDMTHHSYLSPDGKTLALVESKTQNLVLLPIDGKSPTVIDTSAYQPATVLPCGFSIDNKYYLYGTITSGSSSQSSLVLADMNGNEVSSIPGFFRGIFLPNNKQIVGESFEQNSNASNNTTISLALMNIPSGDIQTPLVDVNLNAASTLFGGFFISKDGKDIYFEDEQGLGKIKTSGGDNQHIYSSKNTINGYALKNGATLVLVENDISQNAATADLYIFDIRRNLKSRIDKYLVNSNVNASISLVNYQIISSPDSRYLAYATDNGDGTENLNIVQSDGNNKYRLARGGNWYSFAFSPDSRKILFIEGHNNNEGGSLFISDLNGKNRVRLDDNVWSFRFIESGGSVMYTMVENLQNSRPQSTIIRIRLDGKQRKVLVQSEDGLYTFLPTASN